MTNEEVTEAERLIADMKNVLTVLRALTPGLTNQARRDTGRTMRLSVGQAALRT
jgi:hypothetical protein